MQPVNEEGIKKQDTIPLTMDAWCFFADTFLLLLSTFSTLFVVAIVAVVFIRITFFWATIFSTFKALHCFAKIVWYLSEVVVVVFGFFLVLFDFYFSNVFFRHRLTQIIKRSQMNVNWERNRNAQKNIWGLDNSPFGQLIFVRFLCAQNKIEAIPVSSRIRLSKVQLSCAHNYVFLFYGKNLFYLWRNSILFNYFD